MGDLVIAGRTFRSRLIVGTGKYPSHAIMRAAHEASGADMVTVAVRRVDISRKTESLLDYIEDRKSTRLNSSHSQISYAVFCLKNCASNDAIDDDDRIHNTLLAVDASGQDLPSYPTRRSSDLSSGPASTRPTRS